MNISTIKKSILGLSFLAATALGTVGTASASHLSGLDFRLDNYKYDSTLETLKMAPAGTDAWMTLHIGGPVDPRSYHTVTFSGSVDNCYYDLVGKMDDGSVYTWHNIDLCHTTDLTVR